MGDKQAIVVARTQRPGYPQEHQASLSLHPGTALFARIQAALPHVPPERLTQPFVRLVRDELLLPWPEAQAMLAKVGHPPWDPLAGAYRSLSRTCLKLPGYYLYNETHTDWLPSHPAVSWPGEQNSVAVRAALSRPSHRAVRQQRSPLERCNPQAERSADDRDGLRDDGASSCVAPI